MTTTDKLQDLIKRCKCGVHVTINAHRDYYESVTSYLTEKGARNPAAIDPLLMQRMVDADTVIEVQFYPLTPIASYEVIDVDLDAAIDRALACFDSGEVASHVH